MQESKFSLCLTALDASGVEFILVGGLAAVIQGAPIQTYDVDIVYSRIPENIERLLTVLDSRDAIFRIQSGRRLRPNARRLQGGGHLDLITRFGPLDLLATIGDGLTYRDLLPQSRLMSIAETVHIQVLELDEIMNAASQCSDQCFNEFTNGAILGTVGSISLPCNKRTPSPSNL